ncbi:DegT/DnrJ/EryC1/StrS family aminotransferase [Agromyces silvae]|uniref:DegT/DnrJ/EryC1/StrS family aminotransferase n=1 Tax=Agromyces silvae TaxID=3388266 RepID=UPI00280C1375|nr:DegT/DnrJ/EryC1/StrS family aminotransferase [Agromyces protaetiae]
MTRLAIDGATPVHDGSWPAWPPAPDEAQRALVHQAMESGAWSSSAGPLCDLFAGRFAAAHGASHGITMTNGTLALFVALRAAGVGPGDDVIVPAYTFVACATSVVLAGATPVIADVDPEHLHLNAAAIERSLTDRSRAVMVVHLAGSPAPMQEINDLAARRGLLVLEDSAQAHGATYRDAPVGAIGDIGTFSFQSSKAMTAGEGGLIVTNDDELARHAWSLCNVGRRRGGAWYGHDEIGWNLRMTEFQAALLLPWLDRLPGEIRVREDFAQALTAAIAGGAIPASIVADPEGTTRNSRHLLILRLTPDTDREWVARALEAEGVPVDLGYPHLGRIPVVAEHARTSPTPDLDLVLERLLWIRQPMLMSGRSGAATVAEALARVLRDPRARSQAA